MDFNTAFERLMGHEGVLSMDQDDPGNWTGGEIGAGQLRGTKYGVSAASYPHEDIPNLTRERAKEIFRSDFWNKIKADKLYDGVAWQAADFAFNSGPQTAIRHLQKALGVSDDGLWGPISQAASQSMSETDQIMRLIAERMKFLVRLRNWSSAGKGWMNRMAANLYYGAEDS